MCLDILEKEEVITYRERDRDLLMRIRSGEYQREDGTYMKLVEEFVMDINRRAIDA